MRKKVRGLKKNAAALRRGAAEIRSKTTATYMHEDLTHLNSKSDKQPSIEKYDHAQQYRDHDLEEFNSIPSTLERSPQALVQKSQNRRDYDQLTDAQIFRLYLKSRLELNLGPLDHKTYERLEQRRETRPGHVYLSFAHHFCYQISSEDPVNQVVLRVMDC